MAISCEQGWLWVVEDVTGNNVYVLLLGCCAKNFHWSDAGLSYLKYFWVCFLFSCIAGLF